MKVKNPSGREYYIQRAKDDRMANWCSRVTPVVLEFDGERAEAYADPELSDWIYIRFNGTTYCNWAKQAGGFDLLNESSLQITDQGRACRKRVQVESGDHDDDDRSETKPPRADNEPASLTREDLEAVASYLPELRDAVDARTNDRDLKEYHDSSDFSSLVRRIVKEFHSRQFMYAFDYMAWSEEAHRLTEDHEAVGRLDLETLRKLLVVHWRQDYWDYDHDHWEWLAANGHLTALLERMQELATEMEPSTSTKSKFVWDDEDAEDFDIRIPEDADENMWPTIEELMAGFDRIRDKITPQQMTMLQVNYHSGGRAVTMRELAKASGYGDYTVANIQYGGLAKRLYKAIGYPAPKSRTGDDTYWILGLGEFVDRREFGLEMQCVMRPGVAIALERLELVDKIETEPIDEEILDTGENEIEIPNAVYVREVDDLSEILPPMDDVEINDFIVYHNPDVMGPLADEPTFEVFTNKSVAGGKHGDRVWLITGEGTPRKFLLACWFYIDEFKSGDDLGFKNCVSGSDGEAFAPFIEIKQDEWFTQLKRDQGNFAFGFSRINTPGAVEQLESLAESVTKEPTNPELWPDRMQEAVSLLRNFMRECLAYGDRAAIVNATSKLFALLRIEDFLLEVDAEEWAEEASRLQDRNELEKSGLLTIRGVLSYYRGRWSDDRDYLLDLLDLTRSGYFLAVLDRLYEILEGPGTDHRHTNSK